MTTAYYTCLNNKCPKHRNVFLDDDPEHADCERERLHLQGESRVPTWLWFAVPAALALAVAVGLAIARRGNDEPQPRTREIELWSTTETISLEPEGHTVPPPMS